MKLYLVQLGYMLAGFERHSWGVQVAFSPAIAKLQAKSELRDQSGPGVSSIHCDATT